VKTYITGLRSHAGLRLPERLGCEQERKVGGKSASMSRWNAPRLSAEGRRSGVDIPTPLPLSQPPGQGCASGLTSGPGWKLSRADWAFWLVYTFT